MLVLTLLLCCTGNAHEITLNSPENGTTFYENNVSFSFTPSGSDPDYLCNLYIDGQKTGDLTEIASVDDYGMACDVVSDGNYVYVAEFYGGLSAYSLTENGFELKGQLKQFDVENENCTAYCEVCTDGTYIYVYEDTEDYEFSYLKAYTFNGTDFEEKGSQGFGIGIDDYECVQMDIDDLYYSNGYLYLLSYGTLDAYEFNGSNFEFKVELVGLYGVCFTENYIYLVNSSGISALTFNGSNFEVNGSIEYNFMDGNICSDGSYVYVDEGYSGTFSLEAYTFNGTDFKECGSISPDYFDNVYSDGNYVYIIGSTPFQEYNESSGEYYTEYTDGISVYTFNGTDFELCGTNVKYSHYDSEMYSDGNYFYLMDNEHGLHVFTFNGTDFELKGQTEDDYARAIVTDGNYIYLANDYAGIYAYEFDGSEYILKGILDTNERITDICYENGYIYAVASYNGLYAYTFNGTDFEEVAFIDQDDDYSMSVFANGSQIYVSGYKIHVYTFNGTDFELNDIGNDSYVGCIYKNYIITSAWGEVYAYTFNGSNLGEKGYLDNFNYDDYSEPYSDGNYIYLIKNSRYLEAYTFNGTDFELKGTFDITDEYSSECTRDIYSDGTYVYLAGDYCGNIGIKVFTFNGSEFNLVTESEGNRIPYNNVAYFGGITEGLCGDGEYIYAASGDAGLSAYEFGTACKFESLVMNNSLETIDVSNLDNGTHNWYVELLTYNDGTIFSENRTFNVIINESTLIQNNSETNNSENNSMVEPDVIYLTNDNFTEPAGIMDYYGNNNNVYCIIDKPGYYVLNESIYNITSGDYEIGIFVNNTENVTIDGNGNTLESAPFESMWDENGHVLILNTYGIEITNSNNVKIKNINICNWFEALEFGGDSDNISLENSMIIDNNRGVDISGNTPKIINNTFQNLATDLDLQRAKNALVQNNNFETGLELGGWSSSGSLQFWNTHEIDMSNTIEGKPIKYLKNTENQIISGEEYGQIILANCTNITVENQNFDIWGVPAVSIAFCNEITVKNTTSSQYTDLSCTESNSIAFVNNTLINSGIFLDNTNYSIIEKNDIIGEDSYIDLYDSCNNNIFLNNVNPSMVSIYNSDCVNNTFSSPYLINYTYNGHNYTNYMGNYYGNVTYSSNNGRGLGSNYTITSYDESLNVTDNYPLIEPFENYFLGINQSTNENIYSEPPVLSNISITPNPVNLTENITVSANLSDNTCLDSINAIINGNTYEMTSVGEGQFQVMINTSNFTSSAGYFTVSIFANNTSGNSATEVKSINVLDSKVYMLLDDANVSIDANTWENVNSTGIITELTNGLNITTIPTINGDAIVIPEVEGVEIQVTDIKFEIIENVTNAADSINDSAITNESAMNETANEILDGMQEVLNEGFTISNKTQNTTSTTTKAVAKISFVAENTSAKGFVTVRIPIGNLTLTSIIVNNGTENITLTQTPNNSTGWYRLPVSGVLEVILVKDPEVTVTLEKTLSAVTAVTTTSSSSSSSHSSSGGSSYSSDLADGITSSVIRNAVSNSNIVYGSEIDQGYALNLRATVQNSENYEISRDTIIVGGPLANAFAKEYNNQFEMPISNDYPGENRGVIQVMTVQDNSGTIIRSYTIVYIAGSDRLGTQAALEYFKTLDELPEGPIMIEWTENGPVLVE
ncbi:hypothetical protein HNP93_000662 [Methanococcus maripaludis]|uniref:Uncharacterized protein n=1 Tax=Methanococcus maripaludis TaxID=39152 RepID=A0A7J9P425_METMI|nr:hypothetical protein [Methanococcus maripaludis]MBA2857961.1 hypothetical protein [Methanococcus maripaludis]